MHPSKPAIATMTNPIEIKTERLHLRQWRASDREPFARLNADARVMAFFPRPLDRSESDVLADRLQSLIAERGWGLWAVEPLDSKEFIGFVGLHIAAPELPFSPCVEIGWRLAYPYWGKGYASEAARAALRVAFEMLGLTEIVAFTAMQNLHSQRVMSRLGMHKDIASFEHPNVPLSSPLRTHCLYRLSRTEWKADVI